MSDYLNNLLARELGRLEAVEPRRPSHFEPPAAQAAFPTAAGEFDDARGREATEPGDVSRTWVTDASAGETDTFAGETETFADASPQTLPPGAPPGLAPEARPHARPPSSFEPRPSENFSPPVQTRARRSVSDAEAADSPSPTPKPETSQTPARPAEKGTLTPDDGGQSRTSSNVSPLAEDAAPSRVGREESLSNPPSRPSPSRREKEEAVSIPPRRAEPPRETLLVPVLDAREVISRAALAPVREAAREAVREADARASQPAETPAPPPSKHSARADDSAASEDAESSWTTERTGRREGSETEAREGRRARQQTASRVEPRVTRRAESRAAEQRRQQADAQAEGASAPTVNVTIGRIEIRASAPAPRRAARREGSGAAPMSLEDYLRRRGGGGGGGR